MSLTVAGIIISVLWIGGFLGYFWVSRQTNGLESAVSRVQKQLEQVDEAN